MRANIHHRALAQHGSVLLEGLIAILIFSVGILAIVGLQAAAIKNSTDAKYRADASYLANQIIAQMRVDNGANDNANLLTYAHFPGAGAVCSPTGSASGNTKVKDWLAAVASAVPGAVSSTQQIVITASNVATVTVCWQAPQESAPHNFVATSQI